MQRLGSFLILGLLFAGPSPAQPFELDPRQWFPLELGSYWHYRCCDPGPIYTHTISSSDRDTLVDGQRWVRFTGIACTGPGCSSEEGGLWYHLTDDAYLLSTIDSFSRIDTLWNTVPRSIFSVDTARDTTLKLMKTGNVQPQPITVTIEPNT